MYKIQIDNIVYYFRTKYHMDRAMQGHSRFHSCRQFLLMADAAIDVSTNSIIKCRYGLETFFDSYYKNFVIY